MAPELQVPLRALECPAFASGVGLAERMPVLSEQIGLSLEERSVALGNARSLLLLQQLTRGDPPHGEDLRPCCLTSRSCTSP